MADMTCPKCAEPWDVHHVRHDAFEGDKYDGRPNMPDDIGALWDAWTAAEEAHDGSAMSSAIVADAHDKLRAAYYASGLAHGCESCWYEPSRQLDGDARMAAVERAMFDTAWDGDPAEILGGW